MSDSAIKFSTPPIYVYGERLLPQVRPAYVYLAGPIDLHSGQPFYTVELTRKLRDASIGSFSPFAAHVVQAPRSRYSSRVRRINDAAIMESDVVIAAVPKDIVSVGTAREIEFCVANSKPIVVVTDMNPTNYLYDVPVVSCAGNLHAALAATIDYICQLPISELHPAHSPVPLVK